MTPINGRTTAHVPDDWKDPQAAPSNVVDGVMEMFRRYCIMPRHAYLPIALWVIATYLAPMFRAFPYVALVSPLKRCGKTRTLEVLELIAFQPISMVSPSPPAIFRSITNCQTLLLDEMETLKPSRNTSESQQALIAILNAGYKKGATVPRCESTGREIKVVHWPVYGPKAFSTTSRLPSTLSDRCIMIAMQRKTKDQSVRRFRERSAKQEAQEIVTRVVAFTNEFRELIADAYDTMPDLDFLGDRDAEIWSPLFAVCTVAAPKLRANLIEDAKALSQAKELADADESLPLKLLGDVQSVWPSSSPEAMHTADLLNALIGMEDSTWKEIELTPRKLARMLKPFGILTRNVRKDTQKKGYFLASVQRAVDRYLPPMTETNVPSVADPEDS